MFIYFHYQKINIFAQYLPFEAVDDSVMLHVTCTSQRIGLADKMQKLAEQCSHNVAIPEHIHCCGFAGDKGFTTPELNENSLSTLQSQVPENCTTGYSNS